MKRLPDTVVEPIAARQPVAIQPDIQRPFVVDLALQLGAELLLEGLDPAAFLLVGAAVVRHGVAEEHIMLEAKCIGHAADKLLQGDRLHREDDGTRDYSPHHFSGRG